MTVVYDNITSTHNIRMFVPVTPQDNVSSLGHIPAKIEFNINAPIVLDLKNFPKNQLPSGGTSNKMSLSEMIVCEFREDNYTPKYDETRFTWSKKGGNILYSLVGPDFSEGGYSTYYSYDYSYIGAFDWEINGPGIYYCEIVADGGRGSAIIEFTVIDTTPAPTPQKDIRFYVDGSGILKVYRNGTFVAQVNNTSSQVVTLKNGDTVRFENTPSSGYRFDRMCDVEQCTTSATSQWDITDITKMSTFTSYFVSTAPPPCQDLSWVCESGNTGYEVSNCGTRRKNTRCDPAPCTPVNYTCEQPLNGYEVSYDCGKTTRRANTRCNPAPVVSKTIKFSVVGEGNIRIIKNQVVVANAAPNQPASVTFKTGDSFNFVCYFSPGWKFSKLCDATECHTASNFVSGVIENAAIITDFTATFIKDSTTPTTKTIAVSGIGNGHVICKLNGVWKGDAGGTTIQHIVIKQYDVLVLTAVPDSGNKIKSWEDQYGTYAGNTEYRLAAENPVSGTGFAKCTFEKVVQPPTSTNFTMTADKTSGDTAYFTNLVLKDTGFKGATVEIMESGSLQGILKSVTLDGNGEATTALYITKPVLLVARIPQGWMGLSEPKWSNEIAFSFAGESPEGTLDYIAKYGKYLVYGFVAYLGVQLVKGR